MDDINKFNEKLDSMIEDMRYEYRLGDDFVIGEGRLRDYVEKHFLDL